MDQQNCNTAYIMTNKGAATAVLGTNPMMITTEHNILRNDLVSVTYNNSYTTKNAVPRQNHKPGSHFNFDLKTYII